MTRTSSKEPISCTSPSFREISFREIMGSFQKIMGSFWYLPKGWYSTSYGHLTTSPSLSFLVGFTWKCDLSAGYFPTGLCSIQLESSDFALERYKGLALPTPTSLLLCAVTLLWRDIKSLALPTPTSLDLLLYCLGSSSSVARASA